MNRWFFIGKTTVWKSHLLCKRPPEIPGDFLIHVSEIVGNTEKLQYWRCYHKMSQRKFSNIQIELMTHQPIRVICVCLTCPNQYYYLYHTKRPSCIHMCMFTKKILKLTIGMQCCSYFSKYTDSWDITWSLSNIKINHCSLQNSWTMVMLWRQEGYSAVNRKTTSKYFLVSILAPNQIFKSNNGWKIIIAVWWRPSMVVWRRTTV